MADPRSLERMLAAARAAALVGGEVIRDAGPTAEASTKSGPGDYVTEVDRASERAVLEALVEAVPDVPVVARGGGAFVDRDPGDPGASRLRVSDRDPGHAVVATGFPFRHKELLPRYGRMLLQSLERFEDLRRPGAASLDLAWVAAGVFDGFFELRLNAWDVAAGGLLIEEAGGAVTDWEGGPDYLLGDILAGPPQVHASLLELARETA